jgi:hypothetical protein
MGRKHQSRSPLAGKKVRIKEDANHPQVPNFGGREILMEDWWDRVSGRSWQIMVGNPACIVYALRSAQEGLPLDDKVLYGKIEGLGHLVHISELEVEEDE